MNAQGLEWAGRLARAGRLAGTGRSATLAAAALAFAALILIAPACGGGGGGGGPTEPPPPQPPPVGITFTAAGGGGANTVTLVRQGNDPNRLSLEVMANTVTDLYGVSFDLRFPSAALRFSGFDEGTLLSSGGVDDNYQVVEVPDGNLVVGATRLGAVGGATGSGTILTLHFDAVASGNGQIAFAQPQAFDHNGAPTAVAFSGGSVTVTR